MTNFIFGLTSQNIPIPAYKFGTTGPRVFILGAVHGDESEGVIAANGLLQEFINNRFPPLQITLVPMLNVDGVLNKTRGNANGVDLNRNLPTKDWSPEIKTPRYHPGPHAMSEPENKALVDFLSKEPQDLIISLHSWHPVLNVNGDCLDIAKAIAASNQYKIDADIGYPTPGCLGTYTGLERNMPTITYEIERGQAPASILTMHIPAIMAGLEACAKKGSRQ